MNNYFQIKKKSIIDALVGVYAKIVILFSLVIVSVLFLFNLDTTVYLINWEHSVYVNDHFIVNLIIIFVLILFIVLIAKKTIFFSVIEDKLQDEALFRRIKNCIIGIILLAGAVLVVSTQFLPGVDEYNVQDSVYLLNIGDYSMFEIGAWLNRQPAQYGLFILDYILSFIFGIKNYLAFELINVVAVAVIFTQLSNIGAEIGANRISQILILSCGIMFFPVMFYSLMVYGNIIGLAFAVCAINNEFRFFQDRKFKTILKTIIQISIAVAIKSTVEIFYVAIVISVIVWGIKNREKKVVLIAAFLIVGFIAQARGTEFLVEKITGKSMENQNSYWSFIAMGMHESDLAPGWWDGYLYTSYEESGNNTDIQTEISKEEIKNRIRYFTQNKDYTVEFYTKKLISTWCNPSYQCFATVRNGSYICIPNWLRLLLTYNGQFFIGKYLNQFVNIVYMGTLLYLLFLWGTEKQNLERLIIPMILVGGVIFLLMWETKARYAIFFQVMLIPIAIKGFEELLLRLKSREYKLKPHNMVGKICVAPFVILGIVIISYFLIWGCSYSSILGEDTQCYEQYLLDENVDDVKIVEFIGQ